MHHTRGWQSLGSFVNDAARHLPSMSAERGTSWAPASKEASLIWRV